MALISGTKLGPYEIQSPLGAGGMGEVYRARTRASIAPSPSRSSPLISPPIPNSNFVGISYDVSPDGKHFVVQPPNHTKSTSITLLTNWPAELKK